MEYFESYALLTGNDGYAVRLYLDRNHNEFSLDFFGIGRGKTGEDIPARLEKAAREYIAKHMPGLKIRVVYIVFGAMLIATIPLLDACQSLPAKSGSIISAAPGVTSKDKSDNDNGGTTDGGKSDTRHDSDLILVNKQNSLPADYEPADLVTPHVGFKAGSSEVKQMKKEAAAALEQLFAEAKKDNITLYAVSGYRSYAKQAAVFAASAENHGSEEAANQYSAKAGQSEHQTGLAMDVTGASVKYTLSESFGETKEGKWLAKNAHRFGFILRYPLGKETITGYQYEPWHIRYVGTDAADAIYNRNITLEEYLKK